MNCLIILLLLACGGCQNSWGGCGCGRSGNNCCQRNRDCDCDCDCDDSCPRMGEGRGQVRCPGMPEEHDHHDHHDHHDDCRQGGPAAWNNFPSISSGESCGCDAE